MSIQRQIYLLGIGMGAKHTRTVLAEDILAHCDCMIGASRMLDAVQEYEKPQFCAYKPEEICSWMETHPQYKRIGIILSGDTGFYSGAKKLEKMIEERWNQGGQPTAEVYQIPGISSIVYLAAKLHSSWDDAQIVSAHGQKQNYVQTIASYAKTFLLLGGTGVGEEVCKKVQEYHLEDVLFYIGKNLSYENESVLVRRGTELIPEDLSGLCTVMVENPKPQNWRYRAIPEEEWIRGKVPMTKEEVREISLRKLALTEDAVLYDIGAGTGSVSIEAALYSGKIRVYAIEKNPDGIALIEKNKRKFRTDWVTSIEGTAPEVLEMLEKPSHVFIGGTSGNLKSILKIVREKNPEAQIVLNAISLETVKEVMEAIEEGLLTNPEVIQISLSKAKTLGKYHMMMGQNPIYIVTDRKEG